jgi:lipopolysaccharide/colanic/teichoic acid biosynthesis glycosyltransferase
MPDSSIVINPVQTSTSDQKPDPLVPAAVAGVPGDLQRAIPVVREADIATAGASPDLPRERSELVLRVMNVLIASTALVAVSPLILIVAMAVKLTSPGPIFYSQARVGIDRRRRSTPRQVYDRRRRDLGGGPFMIYKFRTMRVGAERRGAAVWATPGDPRLTPVGGLMRKYRLDELPQLINVIKGEMNIVGPRPERPSIFSRLSDDIADYPMRQRAKPGITGWAQVNHDYDTNLDDVRVKVRYDLEYLKRQGVTEDLKIMARTLPVIIFRRGGW